MLTVKDLHKSYQVGKTTYEVLKGVSLSVETGEFVAVMGPSGSGKTTLLNCISCYIPADSGQITLGTEELARLDEDALAAVRNRKLGFVFQDFLLLDGLTVRENILLPAIISGAVGHLTEARADQLCDVFGISAIRNKYPAEISGGEKQRTAVARALINHPLVILADEPTGNLDSKSSRAVIRSFAAGPGRSGRHHLHGDARLFRRLFLRPGDHPAGRRGVADPGTGRTRTAPPFRTSCWTPSGK